MLSSILVCNVFFFIIKQLTGYILTSVSGQHCRLIYVKPIFNHIFDGSSVKYPPYLCHIYEPVFRSTIEFTTFNQFCTIQGRELEKKSFEHSLLSFQWWWWIKSIDGFWCKLHLWRFNSISFEIDRLQSTSSRLVWDIIKLNSVVMASQMSANWFDWIFFQSKNN